MVAPSFKNFSIVGETYIKGARRYVKVKNPANGNIREVRWYTEQEFTKAFGQKFPKNENAYGGLKHARGFDNGPILVIRGIKNVEDEKWCEKSIARFAVGIGWYIISTATFPDDAPEHFKYLLLSWDEFRDGDDNHMKTPSEISAILEAKAKRKEWFNIK